ncbi:MAG: CCA tRNA nucleotidyltransferase [Proteobacteria bacterium]|nr:CCA tRNA nucleotidyltransferase [Pseudomonadota bacterium]
MLDPLPPWANDAPASTVLAALGPDARFVGGCVRDALIGAVPVDIDIGVPYPPEDTIAKLTAAKLRAIPTGIEHGTVTALSGKAKYEITSLRRDVETFGRHARVAFDADWREDAARRDFTINALSLDQAGALHDYFDGRADLEAGRVRFIGDAATRIREDVLRILRFFRFHARFARGDFDGASLAACRDGAALLPNLSAERVCAEMFRLLAGPNAASMLAAMRDARLLAHWLPEADEAGIAHIAALDALETKLGVAAADPIRRLACFALDAREFARRWRLSNAQAARLERFIRPPARIEAGLDAAALSRVFYWLGDDLRDRALIDAALFADPAQAVAVFAAAKDWVRPEFPIGGEDLRAAGVAPGPAMGNALRAAERAWVDSNFSLSKENLLARAAKNEP